MNTTTILELLVYGLGLFGGVSALAGIYLVGRAFFRKQDRLFQQKQDEFLQQKSRVEKHLKDSRPT